MATNGEITLTVLRVTKVNSAASALSYAETTVSAMMNEDKETLLDYPPLLSGP